MLYPGHVTRFGDSDQRAVKIIQTELERRGCGPLDPPGVFGAQTEAAVKFFQARNVDAHGSPLEQDGKVGALTWGALFGETTLPSSVEAASPFLKAVLLTAASKVGVLEQPKDSNSGPDVDRFLQRAGVSLVLPASQKPWCCAFVYWCFDETARLAGRPNPMMRTASCLDHWSGAANHGARRIRAIDATDDPSHQTGHGLRPGSRRRPGPHRPCGTLRGRLSAHHRGQYGRKPHPGGRRRLSAETQAG